MRNLQFYEYQRKLRNVNDRISKINRVIKKIEEHEGATEAYIEVITSTAKLLRRYYNEYIRWCVLIDKEPVLLLSQHEDATEAYIEDINSAAKLLRRYYNEYIRLCILIDKDPVLLSSLIGEARDF